MAQQSGTVCLLLLGTAVILCLLITIPKCAALPDDVPDTFYEFGTDQGDLVAPVNDDGSTTLITISTQFPYFDNLHDSLYVNTNGLISFLIPVSQFTPDAFPLGGDRRFVAPFWADVDTSRNGEDGRVYYRETSNSEILERATGDVLNAFIDQTRFRATWMFVATWHRVTFFGGSTSTPVNSFQVVLISNGRHSFTVFNYGDVTWTTGTSSGGDTSGMGGTPAQAGFNAGDGIRYFSIPGSRTPEIVNVETTSNVGRAGRWVFRIDSAEIKDGGCNTGGSLTVSPRFGSPLGGQQVMVAGPCLDLNDTITCRFDDVETRGHVVTSTQASCVSPLLITRGRIPLAVSVNGGEYTHHGIYIVVNELPQVKLIPDAPWRPNHSSLTHSIQWMPADIDADRVDVDLVAFQNKNGKTETLVIPLSTDQVNDGVLRVFTLPSGASYWVDVGAIRVRKSGSRTDLSVECLWSKTHVVDWYTRLYTYELALDRLPKVGRGKRDWDQADKTWNSAKEFFSDGASISEGIEESVTAFFNERCDAWYKRESSNPPVFDVDPCPCTLNQVRADDNFEPDPACNMGSGCHFHPGAFHCIRSREPSPSGGSQQCCYSKPGSDEPGSILPFRLANGELAGGTFDKAHYKKPPALFLAHIWQDVLPFKWCCDFGDKSHCDKYGQVRPSDDCSSYEPPRPAVTMGDPHIITLDGKQYTFNGVGEYTLIDVDVVFTLQGRTKQAVDESGAPIRASMWTAFAMQSQHPLSDRVQVETNQLQPLQVLINGEVENFDDLPEQEFDGVDVIVSANFTKALVTFASGFNVRITAVEESLQFQLTVSQTHKGKTRGLLGTWNDDESDDFLTPQGVIQKENLTMAEIHEFGQLWQTDSNISLFTYPAGKGHSDFQNPDFEAIVDLEDFTQADLGNATALCGDESFQCVYDFLTTGRLSFALATNSAKQQYIVTINNTQPVLSCGFLDTPQNGSLDAVNYFAGSSVTFSCDDGFYLEGSETRLCQEDGIWSGQNSTCIPVALEDGGMTPPVWVMVAIGAGGAAIVFGLIGLFAYRHRKNKANFPV